MVCRPITRLIATPWSTRDKSDATVSFKDAPTEEERRSKRIEDVPKAFRINYGDLVQHGFTDGCPQCDHNAVHQKSKAGLSHTKVCRTRMLDALMNTPEGHTKRESTKQLRIELKPPTKRSPKIPSLDQCPRQSSAKMNARTYPKPVWLQDHPRPRRQAPAASNIMGRNLRQWRVLTQ